MAWLLGQVGHETLAQLQGQDRDQHHCGRQQEGQRAVRADCKQHDRPQGKGAGEDRCVQAHDPTARFFQGHLVYPYLADDEEPCECGGGDEADRKPEIDIRQGDVGQCAERRDHGTGDQEGHHRHMPQDARHERREKDVGQAHHGCIEADQRGGGPHGFHAQRQQGQRGSQSYAHSGNTAEGRSNRPAAFGIRKAFSRRGVDDGRGRMLHRAVSLLVCRDCFGISLRR